MKTLTPVSAKSIERYRNECERALARQAKASDWPAERTSFLQKQISEHFKSLQKLARLNSAGRAHAATRTQKRLLRSFPARLCGTLYELTRYKGAAEPLAELSWSEFEKLVQKNPLSGHRPDPCRVFTFKKANDEKRIVTSPGSRTRSAQKPLAMAFHASGIENRYDFNRKGAGQPAALREIQRLMIEDELRWFVVFDLAKYFTSVRPQHLKGLRLPREVQQSVFYNRSAMLIRRFNGKSYWSFGGKCDPARRGIPQGAPASGILASALLGRELRNLGGELGIVTYVDDGVIGARTQLEANTVVQALKTRFANLDGGPIHFKHITVCDARKGLEFLGYWIRLVEGDEDDFVRFTPSHQAKNRFRRKLFSKLDKKGPNLCWDEALDVAYEYRDNWLRQKSLWRSSEINLLDFDAEMSSWVEDYFHGYTKKLPPFGEKM